MRIGPILLSGALLAATATPVSAEVRTAQGQGYAFFGSRIYWNPCEVITYAVDTTYAQRRGMRPAWEIDRWKSVVAESAAAMGVRFRYVGQVRTRPSADGPRRVRGVDIVITYGSSKRSGRYGYGRLLDGGAVGAAGVTWVSAGRRASRITSGHVVIDARDATAYTSTWTAPFDARPVEERPPDLLRALYLHEWGHALGLDHVRDRKQIMYPRLIADRPDALARGDRTGLRRLGAKPCLSG